MLIQYNVNNSKTGQARVNIIYSQNNTLSKVTIINGTRFKINYPYNLANNLSSNVLMVKNLKIGEKKEQKSKILNNAAKSLELNMRKVRILSNSTDNKFEEKFLKGNNNVNYNNLQSPIFAQKIKFDLDHSPNIIKKTEPKFDLLNKINEDRKNLRLDIKKSN